MASSESSNSFFRCFYCEKDVTGHHFFKHLLALHPSEIWDGENKALLGRALSGKRRALELRIKGYDSKLFLAPAKKRLYLNSRNAEKAVAGTSEEAHASVLQELSKSISKLNSEVKSYGMAPNEALAIQKLFLHLSKNAINADKQLEERGNKLAWLTKLVIEAGLKTEWEIEEWEFQQPEPEEGEEPIEPVVPEPFWNNPSLKKHLQHIKSFTWEEVAESEKKSYKVEAPEPPKPELKPEPEPKPEPPKKTKFKIKVKKPQPEPEQPAPKPSPEPKSEKSHTDAAPAPPSASPPEPSRAPQSELPTSSPSPALPVASPPPSRVLGLTSSLRAPQPQGLIPGMPPNVRLLTSSVARPRNS